VNFDTKSFNKKKLCGRSSFRKVGQQTRTVYQEDCTFMYVNMSIVDDWCSSHRKNI